MRKSEDPTEGRERKPVLNPVKLTTDQIDRVSDLLLTIPFTTLIAGNLLPSNDPKIVLSAPEPPVKTAEPPKASKPPAKVAARPPPKPMGKAAAKSGGKAAVKPAAKPPATDAQSLDSWLDGLLS
jgi:hypothetical protein